MAKLTTVYGESGSILGDIDVNEPGALSRLYHEVYGPDAWPDVTYYYTAHTEWVCETLGSGGAVARLDMSDVPAPVVKAWSINLCHHCALTLSADECGPAEIDAVWVDADGDTDGKVVRVCKSCLDAGSEGGPGYRAVIKSQ